MHVYIYSYKYIYIYIYIYIHVDFVHVLCVIVKSASLRESQALEQTLACLLSRSLALLGQAAALRLHRARESKFVGAWAELRPQWQYVGGSDGNWSQARSSYSFHAQMPPLPI